MLNVAELVQLYAGFTAPCATALLQSFGTAGIYAATPPRQSRAIYAYISFRHDGMLRDNRVLQYLLRLGTLG